MKKFSASFVGILLVFALTLSSCDFLQAVDEAADGTKTTAVADAGKESGTSARKGMESKKSSEKNETGTTRETGSDSVIETVPEETSVTSGEGNVSSGETNDSGEKGTDSGKEGTETEKGGNVTKGEGNISSGDTAASSESGNISSGEGTVSGDKGTGSSGEGTTAADKGTSVSGKTDSTVKTTTSTKTAGSESTVSTTNASESGIVCYQTIDSALNLNDGMYFFYFSRLNDSQKKLYNELSRGVSHGETEVNLQEQYSLSQDQVSEVIMAVYYDHPEYFWITPRCELQSVNNRLSKVTFTNLCDNLTQAKTDFGNVVNTILNNTQGMSNYDYEKYVHDYLCNQVAYLDNAYDQTAYGALVKGQAVCAGYARAFQYLMMKRLIPCYYIPGTGNSNGTMENHGWNMIYLGDGYYYVDVTWDDQESGPIYTYLNAEKTFFEGSHFAGYGTGIYPSDFGTQYLLENIYGNRDLYEAQNYANTNCGGGLTVASLQEYLNYGFSELVSQNFTGRTFVCSETVFEEIRTYINSEAFVNELYQQRLQNGLTGAFSFEAGYAYWKFNDYIVFTENYTVTGS